MEDYYDYDDSSDLSYLDIYENEYDMYEKSIDYTLYDLWKDCLTPTLKDGFHSALTLLICCSLLKVVLLFSFSTHFVFHIASSLLGLYCLYSFFSNASFYVLFFACLGYITIFILCRISLRHQGSICAIICYMFLVVCELFFAKRTLWHRIRGCQMILSMKLISLSFDIQKSEKEMPSLLSVAGYLFHPGSLIFGPWMNFSSYIHSMQNSKLSLSWLYMISKSLLFSFGFLTVSTCWSSWFFFSTDWKWVAAYQDALSFRSSHYFVCYLSEATAIASGLRIGAVTAGFEIEIPRSLVEVVVWWNVPMHFWLKTYVFKNAKLFGNFVAILLTYVASALLHGLNFQLAAVLLSLGFYTYIEHVLRGKLGDIFEACILARKCKDNCGHTFKYNNPYVFLTNIGFGLLSVFHLAYLGVMFDSTSSLEEEGYNMSHTLKKWADLNYGSHWVAIISYVFYYLI